MRNQVACHENFTALAPLGNETKKASNGIYYFEKNLRA
jgi:hypothetical protein